MSHTMEIEVSDRSVAREVAYAIMGRAADINNNPDDEHQDVAEELRELAQDLIEEYEGDA
jgi:hypothetical protein